MRLGTWTLGIVIATSAGAFAEAPAPAAAPARATSAAAPAPHWDDSHMQSRYQETPPSNRPHISGQTGYAALEGGRVESRSEVPEQLEYTSQRQWVQGSLSGPSKAKQAEETEEQTQQVGSVHRGGNDAGRNSQLRRGAVHGSSGRH